YTAPTAYAQSLSISNLYYPSTVGINFAFKVSFTVSYSGASSGEYLIAGIVIASQNSVANGHSWYSTPLGCRQVSPGTSKAACVIQLGSGQGVENFELGVVYPSAGNVNLIAEAYLVHYSPQCSYGVCV